MKVNEQKKTICFSYVRVSTEKQMNNGNGLNSQTQQCKEQIDKKGFVHGKIYKEEGESGAYEHRPALQRMLLDLEKLAKDKKNKNYEYALMVDEFTRLAREQTLYFSIRKRLRDLGIKLYSVRSDFDESPMGTLFENMYVAFGSFERDIGRQRVITRMASRFNDGVDVYGRSKIGYYYGKNLNGNGAIQTPHPINSNIIKDILEKYASGNNTSLSSLAEYATACNIVHEQGKSRGGPRNTSPSTIKNTLLNSSFYAGYITNPTTGEVIKGKHIPLISIETHHSIQNRLNGDFNQVYRKSTDDMYPLKGDILCDECCEAMTSNGHGSKGHLGTKYLYYQCKNRICTAYKKGIRVEDAHSNFIKLLEDSQIPEDLLKNIWDNILKMWNNIREQSNQSKRNNSNKIKAIELTISNLVKKLATSDDSISEYIQAEISSLSLQKGKLQQEMDNPLLSTEDLEQLKVEIAGFFADISRKWSEAAVEAKKLIQSVLFPTKLRYSRKNGFRKPDTGLLNGLTGGNLESKSDLVIPAGFEPATP